MNCLTEEVLQRRFDGELTAAEAGLASAHLAACAACAAAAHRLADEMAMISSVFVDTARAVSVPTARLQARLRAAIENETTSSTLCAPEPPSRWRRFVAASTSVFAAPSPRGWATAAASLIAVGAILGTLSVWELNRPGPDRNAVAVQFSVVKPTPLRQNQNPSAELTTGGGEASRFPMALAGHQRRSKNSRRNNSKPEIAAVKLLPGEKSYLKAIVSLESNFQARGDLILRPEARVEYERNLAVVDQAIVTTRAAAMRDPFDSDANSMLLYAYQSKVELMSSAVTNTENSFGGQ